MSSELSEPPEDEEPSPTPGLLDPSTVNVRFEVPLPECGVRAITIPLRDLQSYRSFTFTVANVMSVAPKDVEVGYTFSWLKAPPKKDVGRWVSIIDDEKTLQDMANRFENFILAEYNSQLKKARDSVAPNLQAIADGHTVVLHSFKQIRKNMQADSSHSTSRMV